nr:MULTISPECIES: cupin domain-containing protein [Marinobacter]
MTSAGAFAEDSAATMVVKPNGSQETFIGPDQYFTGHARVDRLQNPEAPSRVSAAYVSFDPGARSAWHTHPLGQTLVVTQGVGWVQQEGGEKIEIKPGDVVWTPPGVKHWHGASSENAMQHIAIQEAKEGSNVEWMEQVSDEQYLD